MGCSSSKNVGISHGGSKSSPPRPQLRSPSDNAHLVALTSSTYGFLRVDSIKKSADDAADAVGEDPVKEMYQKMMNLDSSASQLPQSWSEVNSVLTQLKSQAQNKKTLARVEPETVDVSKLLQSEDDDIPRVAAKSVTATAVETPKAKPEKREFSVIHTLEEVDQIANSAASQESDEGEEEDEFLEQSTRMTRPGNRYSMSSVIARPNEKTKAASKASRSLSTSTAHDHELQSKVDSTLFDAEFLESFKEAFEQLSTGVPSSATTTMTTNKGKTTSQPRAKATAQIHRLEDDNKPKTQAATANIKPERRELPLSQAPVFQAAEENKLKAAKIKQAPAYHPAEENKPKAAQAAAKTNQDQERRESFPLQAANREEKKTSAAARFPKAEEPRNTVESKVAKWNSLSSQDAPPPMPPTINSKVTAAKAPPKAQPDPVEQLPKKCPPGGDDKVVLYSTSLRGIRKTFEDCSTARSILQSFNIEVDERDVSMDALFRQELKDLMADKPVAVPRVFVRGRYLGGVEEVVQAHESGRLAEMLRGIPRGILSRDCDGCGGVRFMPCTDCSGSCKTVAIDGSVIKCPECNENGLVRCPICS